MVYETVLTILFAVAIGAAIIAYAARPRTRGASISAASVAPTSAIESFAPAETVGTAQMPQVTAVETPTVEPSTSAEYSAITSFAPAVAESAAGASEVPLAATADVSAVAPVPAGETTGSPAQTAPKAHRTQRRRSTATKTHARPSAKTTRKH